MQFRPISQELYQSRKRYPHSTLPKPVVLTEQQISRYLSRVTKGREDDCWLFQANQRELYPRFQKHLAHRIAYFIAYGDIPEGLTIDHLCSTMWCQNPKHLEAVTADENRKRQRERKI